jgi:SAM-dependent methyltransferase
MADAPPSHCKLCELSDFSDPELSELIRDVYASDFEYFGDPAFPVGHEYRKYWEVAMTARAFRDLGVLRDDSRVLGVGAGHEATIYWLTRHVGRVVATDLYEHQDDWSDTDSASGMLTDPGSYWDGAWNPDRLEVRNMSGLQLDFPDESFDGIFSSSSLEHFGEWSDVRRSVEEMYRVLRPGGVAALSTEFRLRGRGMGWTGVMMFSDPELRALLLDGIWWKPATPLDTTISEDTVASALSFSSAATDLHKGSRGWSRYPHVVLTDGPFTFTSVHLALVKSPEPVSEWRRREHRGGEMPEDSRRPRIPIRRRIGKFAYRQLSRLKG